MSEYILACVYVLAALLGLCVGSFLNVVAYRVPEGMSLATPPSHCTKCNYTLKWYDNIPVISYLILGGRCRKCREKISPLYLAVELVNGALWLSSAVLFWQTDIAYAVITALTSSILICVFLIDLKYMLVYDRFVLMLLGLAVLLTIFDGCVIDHVVGAAVGGISFVLVYCIAIFIMKKEGLGLGDVKLAAAAGALLGWQKFLLAILIASVSASIVLMIIKAVRKDEDGREYPFAPFIAIGTALSMFFGDDIISFYLELLPL